MTGVQTCALPICDPEPFQYLDVAAVSRDGELRKLTSIESPWESVTIGTAVPYAKILEGEDATYARGAEEGIQQAIAFFALEDL